MLDDRPYVTLSTALEHEIAAIKGSRFIALAAPVDDEQAVERFIREVQARYPDARHHCWAYQLRQHSKTRFNDDGEPSGSAGKPILAPIIGRQLMDVMVVVVRYFGGVKLGVGGLVRAYSQAANAVLEHAQQQNCLLQIIPKVRLMLRYHYDLTSHVAAALAALQLSENNIRYSDCIDSELAISKDNIERVSQLLTDYTAGKIHLTLDKHQ